MRVSLTYLTRSLFTIMDRRYDSRSKSLIHQINRGAQYFSDLAREQAEIERFRDLGEIWVTE